MIIFKLLENIFVFLAILSLIICWTEAAKIKRDDYQSAQLSRTGSEGYEESGNQQNDDGYHTTPQTEHEEEYDDPNFKFLIFNETGTLYPYYKEYYENIQGPCNKFTVINQDPRNPEYLICNKCMSAPADRVGCNRRPLTYWEETQRCHFAYEQGPCHKDEWLVRDENGATVCQNNPCPLSESTEDSESKSGLDFSFTYQEKCYKTGSQAFCDDGKNAFFLDGKQEPECREFYSCTGLRVAANSSPQDCPSGTNPQEDGGCAHIAKFHS